MLVVSPFINIFNIVMVFQGFEKLVVATQPLDTTVSEAEQMRLEKGRDGPADTLFETMAGFTFPFIMNYGFATCSGIYLMTLVEERERKTR
jgi:ABC-type Na+ efflux pump permease subunit